jgi:regulator of protease activity HflC (stomatin/prohibitin superfamily)
MRIGGILSTIAVVMFMILFIFTFRWINIAPTDVGVEVNKIAGNISPEPLSMGYHFYNGWKTDIVKYHCAARAFPPDTSESEEAKQYTLGLKTNDGQNIDVDLTIIYSLRVKEVPVLHQQIGVRYEDQILLPQVRSEARIIVGSYSAEEIYQGKVRNAIQDGIRDKLIDSLKSYPAIQVNEALLRHFSFSPEFEKAIEEKKLAAQDIEINKNQALAQEELAKKQEAEGRGIRLNAVQKAEGEASAKKIAADAERYKLEQEAAGNLAIYKADAEGKRLQTMALGSGENLVALKFAENIPDKLQVWGVPVGQNNTSIMDISGVFKNMFKTE